MLNENKVKLMTKLARYEEGEGRTYLPISKFYRSDYIGLALIKNFFLVTIGYGLLVLLVVGYYLDYLMDNIHKMNLFLLGGEILGGYLILLLLYSFLTYIQYSVRYSRAKKSVKQYYQQLGKLNKIYTKEEKRELKLAAMGRRK